MPTVKDLKIAYQKAVDDQQTLVTVGHMSFTISYVENILDIINARNISDEARLQDLPLEQDD